MLITDYNLLTAKSIAYRGYLYGHALCLKQVEFSKALAFKKKPSQIES